ncbi:MAG: SLBB domain-containing protein, partial [Halothece sp. Uz-M2-17]|nr:SLBB domain-containing protein [Halothece sp. Uz-M2-17]
VAIAGEVNRPGSYVLSSQTTSETERSEQFPPITEAIKQAGGITRSANVRQVKLHRVYRGEPYVLNVNLWKLVDDGDIVQDVTLRDGDRIVIPTVAQNNPQETRLLAQSAIAPVSQSVEVAVVGEVNRPGSHEVSGGDSGSPPTVTQAIEAAGGITNLSNIRKIRVERSTRKGGQEILSANLWALLQEGKVSEDVLLQSGDTVVVPKAVNVNPTEAEALASASFSPQTIRVNIIGEAERTGTLELPANTPLNQAILAAGGFNDRADKGEIELVRLNPNGTVTRQEYDVDLNAGIDAQSNPTLRNNDVIVVERSTIAAVGDTVGNFLRPVSSIFQGIRFFDIFFGND